MWIKQVFTGITASFLLVAVSPAHAEQWSIKGNFIESCSCKPTCPCNFGSEPTHHHCESNALVQIEDGHYGQVELGGVSVVLTFRLGDWVKYYVSEDVTDQQSDAVVKLIENADLTGGASVLSTERAKISVQRTATTAKFSVPESSVEIELMQGLDGAPIQIKNLLSPFLIDYTQYRSVTNQHTGKDKKFSYTGTNGTVARINASGG